MIEDKYYKKEYAILKHKGEDINLEITDEFQAALQILEETDNSIFITGKAGCGKSSLLNLFVQNTEKTVAVLAFTGLAAINVNGETIHSFFKFSVGLLDPYKIKFKKDLMYKLKEIDVIVIDEISMVRADFIDGINKSLQLHRGNDKPFGGVQMIFIGDLYQLPPIISDNEKRIYNEIYDSPYFFSARIFKDYSIPYINLTKVHRQTDETFINVLNTVRERTMNLSSALDVLNTRILDDKRALLNEMLNNETVCITTTNKKSAEINNYFLNNLKGKEFYYKAKITGDFTEKEYPTDSTLKLKLNSKVMFIRNDTQTYTYVNGDIGFVRELNDHFIIVEKNGLKIRLDREVWEKKKYNYIKSEDVEQGRIDTQVIGKFEQYPIKLAWSNTIHKAQGQTYNRVFIDFDKGTFSSGQSYVALSRCRSLDGILMKRKMYVTDVILDDRVKQFYTMFTNVMDLV